MSGSVWEMDMVNAHGQAVIVVVDPKDNCALFYRAANTKNPIRKCAGLIDIARRKWNVSPTMLRTDNHVIFRDEAFRDFARSRGIRLNFVRLGSPFRGSRATTALWRYRRGELPGAPRVLDQATSRFLTEMEAALAEDRKLVASLEEVHAELQRRGLV